MPKTFMIVLPDATAIELEDILADEDTTLSEWIENYVYDYYR